MQINVTAPGAIKGVVEFDDEHGGPIKVISGDFTAEQMAVDLSGVTPNSATGDVNTLDAEPWFVLRSLATVGWLIEWPEVEGGDEDDPDDSVYDSDVVCN